MDRKTVNLSDMYSGYTGPCDKATFKEVCKAFNLAIIDELLEGRIVHLGFHLGYLRVIRKERNFNKPRVDWGESNKLKEELLAEGKKLYDKETDEGHKWIVFHTDDTYCKVYWSKFICKIKNKTVYKFVPSRGTKGLSTRISEFLNEYELNYQNFPLL